MYLVFEEMRDCGHFVRGGCMGKLALLKNPVSLCGYIDCGKGGPLSRVCLVQHSFIPFISNCIAVLASFIDCTIM